MTNPAPTPRQTPDTITTRGFNGSVTFSYRLSDGVSPTTPTATVTITVANPPDPAAPVAVGDTYPCPFNAPCTANATAGVLANDSSANVGSSLAATLVSQPSSGSVSLANDGSFVFTPQA
jgi:hypothetical protein